jgi:hypothetical protein
MIVKKLVTPGIAALVALAGIATAAAQETKYLAFQIFEGMPDPVIPFDAAPLVYSPADKVGAIARDIVTRIGVTGGTKAKLAVILGPISFDHTDAEARQIIADGFAIALAENIAVGFHLDESMYWSKRTDLTGDPANVEWTSFSGNLSTGLKIDWAHPAGPRMCFNAPAIQAEVTRRARDVIGAEIAAQVASLPADKKHLFAGIITGWETHMGQDVGTGTRLGYHALANGRPTWDRMWEREPGSVITPSPIAASTPPIRRRTWTPRSSPSSPSLLACGRTDWRRLGSIRTGFTRTSPF